MHANGREFNAEPITWRGAALQDGRSIGRQQAAPGNYPACPLRPSLSNGPVLTKIGKGQERW